MRPGNKLALAEAKWALIHKDTVGPTGQRQYMYWVVGSWCTE